MQRWIAIIARSVKSGSRLKGLNAFRIDHAIGMNVNAGQMPP
jgi:hypothetical protein